MKSRLESQIEFLNEIEKLKVVYRRNVTIDRSRSENSAEHSWHIAVMALVFSEHSNEKSLDMSKVVKMLLVHDLVEVYAGDTWLFEDGDTGNRIQRERTSADRLFSLLPHDQACEFRSLWDEFEDRRSSEAIYAAAIDSLQPLINCLLTGRGINDVGRIEVSRMIESKKHISLASHTLWELAQRLIQSGFERGLFHRDGLEAPCNNID
jgi:putative hydrolase of HD superfamily